MIMDLQDFRGEMPKISPALLPQTAATQAVNCKTDRRSLRAIKAPLLSTTVPNTARSIYYYKPSAMWLYWPAEGVNAARSPIARDAYDRLYYTGDNYPKYTYQGRPSAGVANGFRLGIPAPTIAPSVGKTGSASGDSFNRYYVFTYVSPLGEEGPPSPVSSVLSITTTESGTLSFTADSLTDYNLGSGSKRRIYRTAQGTSSTEFLYVADVAIETTSFIDNLLDVQLGGVFPAAYWYPPPSDLQGLMSAPNGFLVGFSKNALYASEIGLPHAWNPNNAVSFPSNVKGITITGDSIIVFTETFPYLVTGSAPASLSSIRIDIPQSCTSRFGMVDAGGYAMVSTPDGVFSVSANDMQSMTQDYFTRDQWQALTPTGIKAFFYEGMYIAFFASITYVLDTRGNQGLNIFEVSGYSFIAGYNDYETDTLYLLKSDGGIYAWESGSGLSATWKSKPLRVNRPINPGAARIFASGAVTFSLYADGVLKFGPTAIADSKPFRCSPKDYLAKEFQIVLALSGSTEIDSLRIASSVSELAT